MAVTKQEEMLLSALRNKRKHMRETLLAEFEEGHGFLPASGGHSRGPSNASSYGSLDSPVSPTTSRRRRMSLGGFSSSSSITMDASPTEMRHERRRSSLAGPPSHLTFATTAASDPLHNAPNTPGPRPLLDPLYKQEYYFSTSPPTSGKLAAPRRKGAVSDPKHLSFVSPASSGEGGLEAERHERVLLYLDRRPIEDQEIDAADMADAGIACVYDGEPSPDLSDFIAFDHMSSGDGHHPGHPAATPIIGPSRNHLGRVSPESEQLGPKTVPPTGRGLRPAAGEQKRSEVRQSEHHDDIEAEDEEVLGVPRPDSPVSPFHAPAPAGRQNAVRLSAVGPAGGGSPTSWWAEDPIPAC